MRHAHAAAAIDAGLRLDHAFLILAVVIRVELVTGRHRRLEQRVIERVLVGHGGNLERAAGAAAITAVTVCEILHAGEERRHALPAPPAIAHLRPGVVVERLTTHPDQAVDRTGAAQQFSTRHRDYPVGGAWLGLRLVKPIGRGIVDQQAEAERHAGIRVAGGTGFEQQHLGFAIFGQACGQRAARRARTDDDIVVLRHGWGSLRVHSVAAYHPNRPRKAFVHRPDAGEGVTIGSTCASRHGRMMRCSIL